MKIGVSNLAWPAALDGVALAMLTAEGASGIEVAPTRIAGWDELSREALMNYRRFWRAAGLEVSSLQAIFFNKPNALLLGDDAAFAEMRNHMVRVGEIAEVLGARIAVFGAPGNRLKGGLSLAHADTLASERFAELGDVAAQYGLVIGIEPVPGYYGGDYLTRADDVVRIVQRCDHPNVRAHFDIGCISLGGDLVAEKIRAYSKFMAHYHASEKDLGPFAKPEYNHAAAAAALREVGYEDWVVIEMREVPGQAISAAQEALKYVRDVYAHFRNGALGAQ